VSNLEAIPNTGVNVAGEDVVDEVRRAIAVLFRPGDVVEVRVPKAGKQKTISGYFKDFGEFARAVERLEDCRYTGVYCTANPVNPALLARADHKLKSFAENTTCDADIVCRRWMLVDLDPKRPAGISSSDAEHAAALDLARQMRDELHAEGWPEPVFSDSGNGAHLLYPIDLPNDPEAADLIKRCLRALAARFNTDVIAVDEGMYNAPRIFKAYGTTARKGDNTEDRPHRVSRMLKVPSSLAAVPIELLHEAAAQAPEKPAGRVVAMPHRPERGAFDLERFLVQHGVRFRPPVAHDGGRKFVLEECPWVPSHRAPDAAVFEGADGKLGFHCFHNSCQGHGWREFRGHLESSDVSSALAQFPAPGACSDVPTEHGQPASGPGGDGARVEDNTSSVFRSLAPYPAPLGEDAYYGTAGRFVRLVEPHTEADPSFMLIQFLGYVGNIVGRRAFVWAGADKHYSNIFLCGVGPTSSGRKGSAAGPAQLFFSGIDEDWVRSIQSGLSSGEGLIWCVRDPIYRREKVSQGKGKPGERHGIFGACTARAAAITLRVSLIYALLDGANEIRKEHLMAALEVWRYCEDSAKYIFGDALGDPTADEILRALRAAPAGMTRTEIAALFDRHKSVAEICRALLVLHNRSLVRFELQKTKGRSVERWYAVWQSAASEE
jgi:hypothetical protein